MYRFTKDGYVQIYERAEKIFEGMVDEFCLIFSSIKAVSLIRNLAEA